HILSCTSPYCVLYTIVFANVSLICPRPRSTLAPYTTLFRSANRACPALKTLIAPTTSAFSSKPHSTHSNWACVWRLSADTWPQRSEEHTSELQSRENLVCRLLLEKKNNNRQLVWIQQQLISQ